MKQSPPIRERESQRNNYTDGYYYRYNDNIIMIITTTISKMKIVLIMYKDK